MVFFHPNSGVAVVHSSQGRFPPFSFLFVFFFVFQFFLRHILQNGHNWSTKVISGPEFLKNDDIWSDFIILDLL